MLAKITVLGKVIEMAANSTGLRDSDPVRQVGVPIDVPVVMQSTALIDGRRWYRPDPFIATVLEDESGDMKITRFQHEPATEMDKDGLLGLARLLLCFDVIVVEYPFVWKIPKELFPVAKDAEAQISNAFVGQDPRELVNRESLQMWIDGSSCLPIIPYRRWKP